MTSTSPLSADRNRSGAQRNCSGTPATIPTARKCPAERRQKRYAIALAAGHRADSFVYMMFASRDKGVIRIATGLAGAPVLLPQFLAHFDDE